MTRFTKLRELLTLSRDLNAEANRMTSRGDAYWARRIEAVEHRLKAEWLVGRLDDEQYYAELAECGDARNAVTDY
jgi:hypothetical protein